MKKTIYVLAAIMLLQSNLVMAQPSPASSPESASNQLVLTDNSLVSGTITDQIRKRGELVLANNGKKTRYKASDLNSARIGGQEFISFNYAFYEVTWKGNSISLLRKASDPSETQYIGSEPVVISSEGKIDDYFIRKNNGPLQLLTTKNVKEVLEKNCGSSAGIEAGKLDIAAVQKLVEACDGK
jgi:hypothetical protein